MVTLADIKNSPVLLSGVIVMLIGIVIALWAQFGKGEKKHLFLGVGLAVGGGAVIVGSQAMPSLFPPPENGNGNGTEAKRTGVQTFGPLGATTPE